MSTKIYNAYVMRDSADLCPFVRDTIRKGRANVRREVMKLVVARASTEDLRRAADAALGPEAGDADDYAYERAAWAAIYKDYREQCSSMLRHEYDFDVRVVVRELGGVLYLIPYADMFMRGTLDFLRKDKRLEDFSYFNNTDRPKGITRYRWEARGKVWDAINDAGWEDFLVVEVCAWQSFSRVVPPP